MGFHWYALQSHPRKEDLLCHQVEIQGLEVYYPRLKVTPVNPRSRKIRPYFPGYLFVNADIERVGISFFQWMPYGVGLVSFGGEPAVVPEALIQAIRERILEIESASAPRQDLLKAGDRVQIQNGPFAGYEAIFDTRLDGSQRVRVLLKMLSHRNLPVEMDARQIKPVQKPKS
jgi:transcriptional antiterminator RfaH